MTQDKKYIPELRFPEFDDDGGWDIMPISDNIITVTPPKKMPSSEYKTHGSFPIIDQSTKFIAGYSYDETALINLEQSDYVVFGDHTCTLKLINFPFIQGADGIKVFKSKGTLLSTRYLYQYLVAHPIHSNEYKRHFSDLKEMQIIYPHSIEEQKKIAECLSSLDAYINATKLKVDQLKEHKKGLMQRLFPAKDKTTPELRFPEFQNNGEWIPRPLSDILNYEQPTPYIVEDDTYKKEGTPVLTANKGFILGYTNESFGIYNKLPVIIFDDFTTDKKYVDFPFKIKSSAIKLLTLKYEERDNLRFVFECMNNIVFNEKEHKRYYISTYQHITILVPNSLQEQEQIMKTLTTVDKQIAEYDKKIKALELHKKGLMQQLFPKL